MPGTSSASLSTRATYARPHTTRRERCSSRRWRRGVRRATGAARRRRCSTSASSARTGTTRAPRTCARARARHEEALSIARAGGFEIEASYALRHLAGHKQDAGDLDGAVAGFEESLGLRERSGYRIYVPPALLALGDAWKQKGDLAKARSLFERALADAEAIGAERFRSAAREALAGLEASPPKP